MSRKRIQIAERDVHPHLKARMDQRGVTQGEIEITLNDGWGATDAKSLHWEELWCFPTTPSGKGGSMRRRK